jgi:hypothetical protein
MPFISRRERSTTQPPPAECLVPFFNFQRKQIMKSIMTAAVLTAMLASFSAFAHHPAADIVDEDIYLMIDENVADTPHGTLDFSSMGR